jgi:hypothetical protein
LISCSFFSFIHEWWPPEGCTVNGGQAGATVRPWGSACCLIALLVVRVCVSDHIFVL